MLAISLEKVTWIARASFLPFLFFTSLLLFQAGSQWRHVIKVNCDCSVMQQPPSLTGLQGAPGSRMAVGTVAVAGSNGTEAAQAEALAQGAVQAPESPKGRLRPRLSLLLLCATGFSHSSCCRSADPRLCPQSHTVLLWLRESPNYVFAALIKALVLSAGNRRGAIWAALCRFWGQIPRLAGN